MIKIKFNGSYEIKFRAFHIDLYTIKGSLKREVSFDPNIHFRKDLGIPGPLDAIVELNGSTLLIHIVAQGFPMPLYTQSIDILDVVNGKLGSASKSIPDFDKFGMKLKNMTIEVTK